MAPVIDVHAHIFNADDIPILGYLRSRRSNSFSETILSWMAARPLLKCVATEPDARSVLCRILLSIAGAVVGKGYVAWAETLPQDQIDICSELIDDYPKVDLFVPLMIDFLYWFRTIRGRNITDIKDQIDYIYKNVIVRFKGKIHPFVAYDPARELAVEKGLLRPDGKPETHSSLALVKDAIENKGFIGVKLYNSLGYRPYNNAEAQDYRRKIRIHRKLGHHEAMSGQDFDRVLYELYDYCAKNGVPITTHCGMGGIEAYHDASWDFGHPTFWADVLEKPEFSDLRVNLAHFGWNTATGYDGKDRKRRASWVKQICEMVARYPNLYTDVSHHRVIDYKTRRHFEAEYAKMRQASGTAWPQIVQGILFGIDWHVIKRVEEYDKFLKAYEDVLVKGAQYAPGELDAFFSGNAMRFLGLQFGQQNHTRLAAFYQAHNIVPPSWYPRNPPPPTPPGP
jgi:predicted TIM-barrel fold metal-dependent hydrolase